MDYLPSSPDSSADPAATLRDYTRAKLAVAALVRDGWDLARRRVGTEAEVRQAYDAWQALLVRLAEDRFNLAVVGQFKRGKSTLINAVLGRELLPTGLLPLTSAITSLCYGPAERVRLRRAGWSLEEEVPLARLADYITERGNPGNEKHLIEARVELPLPFLRRGLYFIDTPGIGSARQENTATTYSFLPQMDAVIFVTSSEAPLSEAEAGFLADIRAHVRQRQVFVVVNKMDLLNGAEAERDEVLDYIRAQVARALAAEKPEDFVLYPLSARDGLRAKLRHDASSAETSGISTFEHALATFLATDQGRTFLVSILDRALHLLPEVPAAAGPASDSEPESPQREDTGTLRQRMESLRARLLSAVAIGGVSLAIEADEAEAPSGSVVVSLSGLSGPAIMDQAVARVTAAAVPGATPAAPASPAAGRRNDTPQSGANTRPRRSGSGSGGGSCPICAAQAEALFAFFAQWQQTLATSPDAQRAFVAVDGFCPAHTWQFQGMASPLGISEGFAPLIEALAAALSDALAHSPEEAGTQITSLDADHAACPACRVLHAVEQQRSDALLARLVTAEGRERYAQSPASASLCLPHLRAVLARIAPRLPAESAGPNESQDIAAFLLREQIRRLDALGEDLRSYALKRDALRRGLTNHDEETAWRRALVQLASERAVTGGATASSEPS